MNYESSKIEKLMRGVMLGLIPPTLLGFLYLGLFAMFARYSPNEAKGVIGQWFFSGPETIGLVYFSIYVLSVIAGYRYGWSGYMRFFGSVGKLLDKMPRYNDDLLSPHRDRTGEVSPKERVKNARNKAQQKGR